MATGMANSTHDDGTLCCPFNCGYVVKNGESLWLAQHVQMQHSENDDSILPFVVKEDTPQQLSRHEESPSRRPGRESSSQPKCQQVLPQDGYIDCPICSEKILSPEYQVHQDFHMASTLQDEPGEPMGDDVEFSTEAGSRTRAMRDISNHFTTDLPQSLRNYDQLRPSALLKTDGRRKTSLKDVIFGSPESPRKQRLVKAHAITDGRNRRLGKAELGPYADERQMPRWLREMLEQGAKVTITHQISSSGTLVRVEAIANETPDLVPVLARLSYLDQSVDRAFYCRPEVRHVCKMHREGGFCGYRNIQMMISYIREARAPGHWHFQDRIPSILRLQDMIEEAWRLGINSSGKIETGGIRMTRKYIGTPEAQALFLSLSIECEADAYTRHSHIPAYEALLIAIGEYFSSDDILSSDEKVVVTDKPPIYFQHQGHSMTIVGFEARKSGAVNLVVFDPMFSPSPAIKGLVGSSSFKLQQPGRLLTAHRRGESYLSKYKDFEIVKLTSTSSTPQDRPLL